MEQYNRVITRVRKIEYEKQRTLVGDDRHRVYFEELTEVAIVQEHVKHDRNLTTGAAKAVDEVATAAASDGKNQRKRGRGKKTKTTTVDGAATADAAAEPKNDKPEPPPKKKKGGQQSDAQPTVPASSAYLAAAVTALTARLDAKGKKGNGKTGKGTGKGWWSTSTGGVRAPDGAKALGRRSPRARARGRVNMTPLAPTQFLRRASQEWDWKCPACGAFVYASKTHCIHTLLCAQTGETRTMTIFLRRAQKADRPNGGECAHRNLIYYLNLYLNQLILWTAKTEEQMQLWMEDIERNVN